MEHPQEHLSDAQIEQCANQSPGDCAEQIESHLSACESCLQRLLKWQRIQFKSFEMAGMSEKGHSGWPDEREIQKVAAGMAEPETAARILQHAAGCDHCGRLLNHYLEIFSEESSPEIETLIDQLPSSRPGWEKKKAREIVAGMRRSPETKPKWWEIVLRPPIAATAGGLAAVLRRPILATAGGLASLAIVAIFWGPPAMEAWQLANAKKLVAKAFAEDRVTEMRFVGVPYADYRPIEGKMGIDGAEEFKHPELMKALTNLSEVLKSRKDDPQLLQMEGRLLLLKNPASQEAEISFLEAQRKVPNDPNLEIDLAVSDFERDTRNSPPGKIPDLSNSINRLEKILRYPQLTREQKAVVLFNLAIAYEKSKSCPQAKDTWDKYLEIDHDSSWSDEARRQQGKDKECMSQSEGSLPDTSDATAFLDHLSDPAVQQNAEAYFPSAVSWLLSAIRQPGSRFSQAYNALADLLKKNHSDGMLSDLFAAFTADEMPAALALDAALQANQQSNSAEAIMNARSASGLFAKSHNIAGELWARYSEIYAYQRKQAGTDCLEAIAALEPRLDHTSYHWLQGHLALERAICRKQAGLLDPKKNTDLDTSKNIAEQFGFPILYFRYLGIAPGLQRLISSTCEDTWGEGLKGLEEYWKSTYPWERLFQFYSVLEQCAEDEQHWYQAKALMGFMIEMRIQKDKRDPDLNVLGMLYIHAAKINTALGDYAGAEGAARQAKAISNKAPGPNQYEPVANIILAECQLKRRNAEEALEILPTVTDISATDDLLDFYRVKGKAHLQLNQLDKAEKAYERGVVIAESSLATATVVKQRIEWAAKTEEFYRGLVQIWLQQKRTGDALRLWEWSKIRSTYAQYPDGSEVPAATSRKKLDWKTLERNIQALPVPSEPSVHLVYAVFSNRLHVWMIDKGQVRSRWIEVGDEKLEKLVDDFARKCADGSSSLEELQKQGEMLFALLIPPFISDFNTEQTVVFEADQQLWKLPIQALRSPDGWYMAEKYYIRYSPGILVEKKLPRAAGRLDTRTLLQVEAYPGFTGNFDQISDRFIHRKVVLGASTNKAELLEEARQSDVLFFFGHAVPEGRGIVLMLNGNNLLRAVDFDPPTVQRLSLVVLAACSTGSSGRYGLLDSNSLVRAFLAGGVPDVVASQWDVDNLSTAELMNRFFQNSLNGEPAAGAMINAEREFLRLHAQDKYRHPYYWAGFMVVGRADSTGTMGSKVALR